MHWTARTGSEAWTEGVDTVLLGATACDYLQVRTIVKKMGEEG